MRIILIFILSMIIVACKFGSDEMTARESFEQREKIDFEVARMNGCLKCHDIDRYVLGPEWRMVAKRYKNEVDARSYLIEKVKNGSSGVWSELTGGAIMPPNSPRVTDAHIEIIVDLILALDVDK